MVITAMGMRLIANSSDADYKPLTEYAPINIAKLGDCEARIPKQLRMLGVKEQPWRIEGSAAAGLSRKRAS